MFSQSADKPAADQPDAPAGMRELPPQPAKPVMPGYTPTAPAMPTVPTPQAEPIAAADAPGPDDSVIAVDDHLEGTFTSRGTVVVKGSIKGRIEAVQICIEDGAKVDADVIVDEAIVAGEFTGNLTCRERLEARSSGRISGRVETFKLMLHEGASVEGEMHMLSEAPKDASETIRGTASLRGDTEGDAPKKPARPAAPAAKPAPAPSVKPASAVSPGSGTDNTGSSSDAVRSSVVDTLKAENARVVAPRTSTTTRGYGYAGTKSAVGSKGESKTTTGF